jgi:hypothetical protein
MFRMLVLQQLHDLSDFELEKNELLKISSENVLVFLSIYPTIPRFGYSEKELLITTKKNQYGCSCKDNLMDLFLKINTGMV